MIEIFRDVKVDWLGKRKLYLAISGLFMIPGRKGLVGRGALIAALGAAVPVGYVVLSGGPEAKNGSHVPATAAAAEPAR